MCLPACLFACLPVCLFACLSFCLPACLSFCLPAFLPGCLAAFVPVCLSVCLLACLLMCFPSCLPACLSLTHAWIAGGDDIPFKMINLSHNVKTKSSGCNTKQNVHSIQLFTFHIELANWLTRKFPEGYWWGTLKEPSVFEHVLFDRQMEIKRKA